MLDDFNKAISSQGYYLWPWQEDIFLWSQSLLCSAKQALAAPENKQWWRHQNTWFAGVNVLPNDVLGKTPYGHAMPQWLQGLLVDYCLGAALNLDKGQVSTCQPGYPKQDVTDSDQAYGFRKQFFAAHMDGLIPEGARRRRFLQEHHSFILGVPLTNHSATAAPLMVWPQSHQRLQTWLQNQLANIPPQEWKQVDLTDFYQKVRRTILEDTAPVPVPAKPGQIYIVHRHLLHGMGLWLEKAETAPDEERIIVYFRPEMHAPMEWLTAP